MSYRRTCDVCGQNISLREMSDGHWVAFDYGTDRAHDHTKVDREDYQSKDYSYKKNKSQSGWINSSYQIESSLIKAIQHSCVVDMYYLKTRGKFSDEKRRQICPLNIQEINDKKYLEAYCKMRKANRVFALRKIQKLRILKENFDNIYKIQGVKFFESREEFVESEKEAEEQTSYEESSYSTNSKNQETENEEMNEKTQNTYDSQNTNYKLKKKDWFEIGWELSWRFAVGYCVIFFGFLLIGKACQIIF